MSKHLQEYIDVSHLYELGVLTAIIGLTKDALKFNLRQDVVIEVDSMWRASIDVYGNMLELNVSTSNTMPVCHQERWDDDDLLVKIVGMVPIPTDIYPALPLSEPELCVLIFECYNEYNERFLDWEIYVRDKFLKLPSSKRFRDGLAAQKLRVDAP